MELMAELMLIGVWGTILVIHTRRLYRLAAVPVTAERKVYLRHKASRMWWWLGRHEFWPPTQRDAVRCLEFTLMVLLFALPL